MMSRFFATASCLALAGCYSLDLRERDAGQDSGGDQTQGVPRFEVGEHSDSDTAALPVDAPAPVWEAGDAEGSLLDAYSAAEDSALPTIDAPSPQEAGNPTDASPPPSEAGLDLDPDFVPSVTFAERISAGIYHTCALGAGGLPTCWGKSPPPPSDAFSQITAAGSFTCGLRLDGAVRCWGDVVDVPDDRFVHISGRYAAACGLRTNGTATCWVTGEWGAGHEVPPPAPPAKQFNQITVGGEVACGITSADDIECWSVSQTPLYISQSATVLLQPPAGAFVQVTVGMMHACALRQDGSVTCWGNDEWGQLEAREGPFAQISAGQVHTCGVRPDGKAVCWGSNRNGESAVPDMKLVQVAAGGGAGGAHTCGLTTEGKAVCWGANDQGQATATTLNDGTAAGADGGNGGPRQSAVAPGPSCASSSAMCGIARGESCCMSLGVPAHTMGLDASAPFVLDAYEVTVGRFRAFVDLGLGAGVDTTTLRVDLRCSPAATWTASADANETLPINCVTWDEASGFCKWDGGRLPSDIEWYLAASGGEMQLPYPWGKRAPSDSLALYAQPLSLDYLLPVGSKPAGEGPWGHSDLIGSMWEWIAPVATTPGAVRGGCWTTTDSAMLRSSYSGTRFSPISRQDTVGFRCAY